MHNTQQSDNERENQKAQEEKKVGGGAEIETDPDWLEIEFHPVLLEHPSSSDQI